MALSVARVTPFTHTAGLRKVQPCRPSLPSRTRSLTTQAVSANKSKSSREVVIPQPSYNLPLSLLAISGFEFYEGWTGVAAFTGILGVFLSIQASRVRFRFDDEALEVLVGADKETENVFVGGKNRWAYDTFINWEFWWPGFPVLVYFKESQTRPEGQIHFFPIIFNGKELYDVMVERCGPSKTSGPKN
mmetsp:Transcript_13620/g.29179  ORF Transcript_13620/g.29179 Transcript_13620/m.29179 type:complete len:189 (+) Transcript_13620:65-631(+)